MQKLSPHFSPLFFSFRKGLPVWYRYILHFMWNNFGGISMYFIYCICIFSWWECILFISICFFAFFWSESWLFFVLHETSFFLYFDLNICNVYNIVLNHHRVEVFVSLHPNNFSRPPVQSLKCQNHSAEVKDWRREMQLNALNYKK